jgi:hypothetical protein
MPATPVRDLAVKDEDLVAATDGRGFWILDDIMPLRQLTTDIANADAYLFRPPTAWRARSHVRPDFELTPGGPSAPDPPEGVSISFRLGAGAAGPVTLEIVETLTGTVLRHYSSEAGDEPLPTAPGLHRVVWDLRVTPPLAPPGQGALLPGPWVLPGTYQVRLTAAGRVQRQAVLVKMDPRIKTPLADLSAQLKLSRSLAEAMVRLIDARRVLRERLTNAAQADGRLARAAAALDEAYAPLPEIFSRIQAADAGPTAATAAAAAAALEKAEAAMAVLLES